MFYEEQELLIMLKNGIKNQALIILAGVVNGPLKTRSMECQEQNIKAPIPLHP
jgi:hypothetical protein